MRLLPSSSTILSLTAILLRGILFIFSICLYPKRQALRYKSVDNLNNAGQKGITIGLSRDRVAARALRTAMTYQNESLMHSPE